MFHQHVKQAFLTVQWNTCFYVLILFVLLVFSDKWYDEKYANNALTCRLYAVLFISQAPERR